MKTITSCFICKNRINRFGEDVITIVNKWFCNLECYRQVFTNDDTEL